MCAYVINAQSAAPGPGIACIAGQLEIVEARLEDAVTSDVGAASDVACHLLEAGGKRIRPALVLLSAGACGGNLADSKLIDTAVAVELVHTASLVHDDVVDETRERRGVKTANDKFGNKLSVLGGDFLLARAFSLLGEIGESEMSRVLSATAVRMTESEVLQAECEGSVEGWRTNYWRIIRGKTAAFTAACCQCGAILSDGSPDMRKALDGFGEYFGLAFQITDDLLDIIGDPSETGKDIGTDLMHGKFTLPVQLALQNSSGDDLHALVSLVGKGFLSSEEAGKAAGLVIECGAAQVARNMALDYAYKANACLSSIPRSDHTHALAALAESIAHRES